MWPFRVFVYIYYQPGTNGTNEGKMDVLKTLSLYMRYITGGVFGAVGNDETKFLNELYKMIEYPIGINFDSKSFFIMTYKKNQDNIIGFDLTDPFIPVGLLIMTRNLVKNYRMKENIKNKSYRIHFREFRDEVYLEDSENTLRVEAFMSAHEYIINPILIRIFLINKLVQLRSSLKLEDQIHMIQHKTQIHRVEVILKAIEMNTVLENVPRHRTQRK
jgi:hypothetical protein